MPPPLERQWLTSGLAEKVVGGLLAGLFIGLSFVVWGAFVAFLLDSVGVF